MSPLRPRPSWWIALAWLAIGIITAAQVVFGTAALGMRSNRVSLFLVTAAAWLFWAGATPLILSLSRRFPLVSARHWSNLAIHLAAALVISAARIAWSAALEWAVNPFLQRNPSYRRMFLTMLYMQFHTGLIIYGATAAVDTIIDSIRRLARRDAEAAQLASELSKAQLDALRRQIEPHFLFNTLNGISALVREKQNAAAVDMIAGLSTLLRRVLEDSGRQLVPLADEVSFLESYIDLQTMRLGDRLKVTVDIPIDLYAALVPQLLLQPLVENAIQHGIGQLIEGGEIRVQASESEGILSICLYNDCPALALPAGSGRTGVGLSNARGRLVTLYGAQATVELRNCDHTGVETIVKVPYRTAA